MGAGDDDVISAPRLVPHPLHDGIAAQIDGTVQMLADRIATYAGGDQSFVAPPRLRAHLGEGSWESRFSNWQHAEPGCMRRRLTCHSSEAVTIGVVLWIVPTQISCTP